MPINAKRWLDKAKRHLSTAHLNHDNGGFGDTTCYFAHQTVELTLKAYLVAKKKDFPKVHALPQLLSLCMQSDASFSRFTDEVAFLNGFYIESKYPLDVIFDPTESDITKAISIAEAIVLFIEAKL